VLGGTDEVSGPVEDDELRQEEWQKLVEENRKLSVAGTQYSNKGTLYYHTGPPSQVVEI
jgi:hypothetical protein